MVDDDRGYTLTEAVLIAALMAVLAAAAIATVSMAFHSWQLYADTRSITSALVEAKLKAISQTTQYQITFDISSTSWTSQKYNRSSGYFEDIGSPQNLSSGVANSGIHFLSTSPTPVPGFPSDSSTSIRFNSRGIPITPSGIPTAANVVYLADGQTSYAITVSLLGRVELWRQNDSAWILQ